MIAFQLDVGGLIWINPELVSSVQRQSDGIVLIRFAAGQPQQVAQVRGQASEVAMKLCEAEPGPAYDRRSRPSEPEAEAVGLFGTGLNARLR